MPDKFVVFDTFSREVEAQIVKTRLAAAGIYSFVADGHMNALYPGMTGVRLLVREDDLGKATLVLLQDNSQDDFETEYICSACGAKLSPEDRSCPNCGEAFDEEPDLTGTYEEEPVPGEPDAEDPFPAGPDDEIPAYEAAAEVRMPEIRETSTLMPLLKGIGAVVLLAAAIMAGRYGYTAYKAAGYRSDCSRGFKEGCTALNKLLGGHYLVFGVDTGKAVNDVLAQKARALSDSLAIGHVPVKSISTTDAPAIHLTLSSARDTDRLLAVIKEEFPDLQLLAASRPPFFAFSFSASVLPHMKADLLGRTVQGIRNRILQSGVTGAIVLSQGSGRIIVDLPGVNAPSGIIDVISKPGRLEFMLVAGTPAFLAGIIKKSQQDLPAGIYAGTRSVLLPDGKTAAGPYLWSHKKELLQRFLADRVPPQYMVGYLVNRDRSTNSVTYQTYFLEKSVSLTGGIITDARVLKGEAYDRPTIRIRLNPGDAGLFSKLTAAHVGQRLAIVVDDTVYSAPVIRERISGGVAEISGSFTEQDAKELAAVLRSGALPAPVRLLSEE